MAKGKPNLAFLEALKQDKRRRGDTSPGGAFKTPEWFDKSSATPKPETKAPAAATAAAATPSGRKGFRLTYTHISIGAVAVLVVAGIAFMATRKQQQPKLSASTEEVRATSAQGSVMEVPAGRQSVAPPAPVPVPSQTMAATPAPPAVTAVQQTSAANIAAQPNGARTIGMSYVVFQSYKEEKMANEAKDALVAGGVGATVEKGLDYAPTWYVVLGTQGFTNPNTREYLQYISKVKLISEKFAGKSKWKLFEPNPYKWKGK